MNKCLFVLVIFIFPFFGQAQEQISKKLDCHFINTPLDQFIENIQQEFHVRFYYKESWLKKTPVTVNGDSLNLSTILNQALKYTQLSYIFIEPNLVVLVEKANRIEDVPLLLGVESQISDSYQDQSKVEDSRFLRGRKTEEKKTIDIGKKEEQTFGKKIRIVGHIYDKGSKEPLIGATLYLPELGIGAATKENGELELVLNPGTYSAEFRCIGMQSEKCQINAYKSGVFNFPMVKEVQSLDEITVSANQDYKIRGSQAGLDKIDIKAVKELPSLMGERDIVKISQLLPGVVSVSEGSGGINVRGGNADQNLLYVNNIPIYNSSHVFGFFTALNPTIINDFSMYKGFIPAQYGGRLSSIFLAETRKGNKQKLFAQGGISPISANAEVEGPVIKDKLSYVVSGRSTYSDWIMKRLPNEDLRQSSVNFNDVALGFDYEINNTNKLQLLGYSSHDFFNLNGKNEYSYNNLGAGFNCFHRFSERLKSQFIGVYAKYGFTTQDRNFISEAYKHSYQLEHTELKASFNLNGTEKHLLDFGFNVINYKLNRGVISPLGEESDRRISDLGQEQGFENAIYFNETFKATKWLEIQAGLRYSFFMNLGPGNVNSYYPDGPRKIDRISEVKPYKRGEIISSYQRPEFRIATDIKTGTFSSFKMAYNEMSQYLFLLNSSFSINPTDQWKLVDTYIKPGFSKQLSMGFYQTLPSFGITFSSEGYIKRAENILEFSDGADFINTKQVETMALQGDQDAYGMEFMVAKEGGRLNGWISYTYSRSMMTVDGNSDWEKINKGITYPSNFDKPNVLNVVGNLRFNRRLVLSSAMVYSTGRPITLPKSVYFIEGNRYVDYSNRNEYRVPDYFRIDVSLTLEGNLKAKKPLHSYWMLNVYNLTGRKNPYSIYFQAEEGMIKGYQYSVIGVPVFTISWNFKLGNYANE
jgi:hypothetical protein